MNATTPVLVSTNSSQIEFGDCAQREHLRRGDLVEVRSAAEIASTLDGDGALDGLPFMPEMLAFCGKRFRVFRRAIQIVIDTASLKPAYQESFARSFKNDDVVLLEGLRCSGLEHGGCSRGCALFWKEAWLRKIEGNQPIREKLETNKTETCIGLRVLSQDQSHLCQSSHILNATTHLNGRKRIWNWFQAVRAGNCSLYGMFKHTAVWFYWKIRRKVFGEWPCGLGTTTPSEALNLRPGELVEVKSLDQIIQTLDRH